MKRLEAGTFQRPVAAVDAKHVVLDVTQLQLLLSVSSAYRHDLDVEAYLKQVLREILSGSTDYESMLPDKWKQAHPELVRTYRVQERRDKADSAKLKAAFRRQLQL